MSNFNRYFKKEGAGEMVDRFFKGIDMYSPKKIKTLSWRLEEEDFPASYYIDNSLTAAFKILVDYTTEDEPDEIKTSEFEVPKEVEGAFIIEGAYRISTNKLGSDYECRIQMSGSGVYKVNFDFDRFYDISKKLLRIKKIDSSLGIDSRTMEIGYDNLDNALQDPKKRELLKLSEKQIKKFIVKLDLDWEPEYIDTRLIDACLAFGDDRLKDLIIDKNIETIPVSFRQYLYRSNNGKNLFSVRKQIVNYWTKHNIIQSEVNSITRLCLRFWKGSNDPETRELQKDLQVPPGVNSMNLESITAKIVIPKSTAFNNSFTDLIDVAATPINNSTNRINELTVSCHVTDEGILFDVFTKNFQKVTIKYIDYLNAKVVSSDFVDYNTSTIVPNNEGKIEIKHRMRRKIVDKDDYDLIDLHPDYRLSMTSRRIPFVNYTDSVRISMGTSMLKQSIPLINAERSLVDTGRNEELGNNVMNEKFKHAEGVVKDITQDHVIISLPNGKENKILRRTALQSINDIAVFTEPKVKVGQKIKKGDIVTGAVGHEKDTYKAGVNSFVLFHAYHGLVNEDALVISESYANLIANYSIIDLEVDIKNMAAIQWLAPIGTKLKSKDDVVVFHKAIHLDEVNKAINEKLGGVFGENTLSEYTVKGSLKIPNSIDDCVVSDILIQENTEPSTPGSNKAVDRTFADTSKKIIKEYMKNKPEARKVIYDKYPEYVARDVLRPIKLDNKHYRVVYTVRVRLIKYSPAVIGEKITSKYGGKGVVSKVVPDSEMPIVVDSRGEKKRVQVVMNPYSTINRKIPSVLMELQLGNIAHRLRDMVEELKKTKTGQKKILPLLSKYYGPRFEKMTVEEFIKFHDSNKIEEVYHFNVGCFSDFKPEQVESWAAELGVTSQSEIHIPEDQLTDFKELEENLDPEEFKEIVESMKGKFAKVDKPLQAGYMSLLRLQHIPSYSNKVTSSLYGVDVDPKRDEPIFGRGRYRKTGQVIGEMELAVLLARNANEFIKGAREDQEAEFNQIFLNNLLGLGLTVTDKKGYNQGGSYIKGELERMKNKFRLKNR